MAKKTDPTPDNCSILERQRAISLMDRRRSRSPTNTPRVLMPKDTNVKSRTRSGKFGIYSENESSGSRQSSHLDATGSGQHSVDVEMQVLDSQFSQ